MKQVTEWVIESLTHHLFKNTESLSNVVARRWQLFCYGFGIIFVG